MTAGNAKKQIKILIVTAVIATGSMAFAKKKPAAPPTAPPPAQEAPGTLNLTPDVLEQKLLDRNLSIILELQNLYTAKGKVSVAQANLLPSLNINLTASLNPISFASKTISALVPFLFPSNWLLEAEAKEQYKAEGVGYYLMKLNNLASADSMYYSTIGDVDTLTALNEQQQMAEELADIVNARYNLGLATQTDVNQAKENLDAAKAHTVQAMAAIRLQDQAIIQLLNIDPETTINYASVHPSPSQNEAKSIDDIAKAVVETSPEWQQMNYLAAAQTDQMKAVEWSFFGGLTLSYAAGSTTETTAGLGLNLSPAIIPNVKLAKIAIEMVRTQQAIVRTSMNYAIGSAINSLMAAKASLEYYQDAEDSSRAVYNDYLAKYQTGNTDLLHVYTAQTDLITQEINRITTQVNVDTQRVALKRVTREGNFAAIKQCDLSNLDSNHKWFHKVGGIFSSPKISVDEACSNTNQEPNIAKK